jgi:NAD(P)-dependent dehydrogenase (short-subunit alcohol dehydrogenase family)
MRPMLERLRFDGPPRKVAIVTGGGRGLGREMARSLSEHGADVCLAARTQSQLDATADFIAEVSGRRPITYSMDVRSTAEMDALVRHTVEHFGRLDFMINNAGGGGRPGARAPIWEIEDDDWADSIQTNLNSALSGTRAAVRVFREREIPGVVINVSSGTALRSYTVSLPYPAAKAGVISLTKSVAAQVAGDGIRVNCIVPGFVLQAPLETDEQKSVAMSRGRFNPVRRLGEAWELGPLAVYLCSDLSSYVTGEMFVIDGGGLAGGIAPIDHDVAVAGP